MDRREEIFDASTDYELNEFDGGDPMDCFAEGARWADSHPKSPWISVKDKLPEVGQLILASYEGAYMELTYRYDKSTSNMPYLDDNGFVIGRNGGKYTGDIVHVDYYLIVPDLPKKGGEE